MKQRIMDHRTVQDFPKQKHGGKFVVEWDSYGDNDDLKAYYPDMKAEHARFFVLQLCLAVKKMRENFRIYEKLFNLEPSRNCKPNLRRGFAWQRIQRLSSSLFCSDLLETKRRVVLLGEELHSQFKRCEKKGQRKEFQTGVFFIFIAENSRTGVPKINKNMYEHKFGKLPIQEISRRKWLKCKPIIAERERELKCLEKVMELNALPEKTHRITFWETRLVSISCKIQRTREKVSACYRGSISNPICQ